MTREDLLLTMLAEECAEVTQVVSKALRFGLHNIRNAQESTNAQRIVHEFYDIFAVFEMLEEEGILDTSSNTVEEHIKIKKARIEEYLLVSKTCGRLT